MQINHADIPSFLRSQGAIGQGMYDKLLAAGHKKSALDAAIKGTGIQVGTKLQSSNPALSAKPAQTGTSTPDIRSLSAFDINKIQQSLNKYKATQGSYRDAPGYDPNQRGFRSQFDRDKREAAALRSPFQSGSDYGIEDEYRYMLSQGFKPSSMQVSSQTGAKAEAGSQSSTPKQTEVTSNIPQYQPQFDTSAFEAALSGINQNISNLTSGFQSQLQTITSQMQQERADATKRMEEMQGNFAQALAAREPRARVEGIRTPDKGTGGASQQQLQRRGVSGTFGRSGDRLMKISSLNV